MQLLQLNSYIPPVAPSDILQLGLFPNQLNAIPLNPCSLYSYYEHRKHRADGLGMKGLNEIASNAQISAAN